MKKSAKQLVQYFLSNRKYNAATPTATDKAVRQVWLGGIKTAKAALALAPDDEGLCCALAMQ